MRPVAVIKLGGSLLDWSGLSSALPEFLQQFAARPVVLIVGGGPLADCVRQFDLQHGLGQERAHRLALRALDLTAWMLADLLPTAKVVDRLDRLAAVWVIGGVPVLQPRQALDHDEQLHPETALPHHWEVTTDSIAAHLACRLQAPCLYLLKSRSAPKGLDVTAAAEQGLVDPHFPHASSRLERVISLNLRATHWRETAIELVRSSEEKR